MQATLAVREAAMQLLAADSATLAPALNGNKVALVKAAFTPSEALAIGDVTLADFDGSTPLVAGTGTQPEGLDPATADSVVTIKPPATGWRWETTGITNLPQTIFGFILMDNAGAVLLASELLVNTITLTAVNQVVNLQNVLMRQLANSIT